VGGNTPGRNLSTGRDPRAWVTQVDPLGVGGVAPGNASGSPSTQQGRSLSQPVSGNTRPAKRCEPRGRSVVLQPDLPSAAQHVRARRGAGLRNWRWFPDNGDGLRSGSSRPCELDSIGCKGRPHDAAKERAEVDLHGADRMRPTALAAVSSVGRKYRGRPGAALPGARKEAMDRAVTGVTPRWSDPLADSESAGLWARATGAHLTVESVRQQLSRCGEGLG
jgi:hypothetical protein